MTAGGGVQAFYLLMIDWVSDSIAPRVLSFRLETVISGMAGAPVHQRVPLALCACNISLTTNDTMVPIRLTSPLG